jgi:starvation-inducible DNA-binding protein
MRNSGAAIIRPGLHPQRLADAPELAAAARQAHRNVKGANFIVPHELFDRVHGNPATHIDTLAERISAPGRTARGTSAAAAHGSPLAPARG